MKLLCRAMLKFIMGLAAVCLLLFWPAGTVRYWNAWLFLGLLFVPMLFLGILLFVRCPELLEKRLNTKEVQTQQKAVMAWSAVIFIGCFVCAGLDFRFGWSRVPFPAVIAAAVFFATGYGLYAEVMRENAYLSRTVEIQKDQKLVDTGLYAVMRHPMYLAVLLLFGAMPILLGSWAALCWMLPLPFILAVRIRNEESVLRRGLDGYTAYMKKVKYRLIPFVW